MYVELQDFESNRRPYLDGLARSAGFRPFQELSAQTDISGVCQACKAAQVATTEAQEDTGVAREGEDTPGLDLGIRRNVEATRKGEGDPQAGPREP